MNAREFYIRCLEHADSIVEHVEPAYFELPTPDTEWTVTDLLRHMMNELLWTADIVAGKTIQEVGDAYEHIEITDQAPAEWARASLRIKKAVRAAKPSAPAHLSYTTTTVEKYLNEAGTDQLIHAWDLAQGIGFVIQFDADLAQKVYDDTKPHASSLAHSGLFAPALTPPKGADIQTKLLAMFGRSLTWQTTTTTRH